MAFTCPECGQRQRGGTPGDVVACSACRNPIVVPEPSPEPLPEAPAPRPGDPSGRGRLWNTAALVLVIVAAIHVGFYLLLTHEARSAIRAIEREHPPAALRGAEAPEAPPQPGTAEYGPWRASVERWDAAQAWANHRRYVAFTRGGILASFLVLVGITLWILLKLLARQKQRSRARGAAQASARRRAPPPTDDD